MNLIIAQTMDNYMAEGAYDKMQWTPKLDKYIFKLLSIYSHICICSNNTYKLLPTKMLNDKYRKFIIAEKEGPNSLINLNNKYPNALLIGGPRFIKICMEKNLLNLIIIITVNKLSVKQDKKYKNPLLNREMEEIFNFYIDDLKIELFKYKRN